MIAANLYVITFIVMGAGLVVVQKWDFYVRVLPVFAVTRK